MRIKRIILIIVILLLLSIIGYLGCKIYYANYYDLSNIENFENYKENFVINDDVITITTTNLKEEEYLIFKNMKIRNIFEGFERKFDSDEFEFPHDSDSVWYVLKDEQTDKVIAYIGFGKGPTHLEQIKGDIIPMGDFRVGEINNLSKLFEKYNITNDIELFKYIEKTKDYKNSIFDSIEDMKNIYSLHLIHFIGYTNIEGITLIDGKYEGYMINHNMNGTNVKEYNILKDDKMYTLTFNSSEYFTDEKIQDLLNTLVIE